MPSVNVINGKEIRQGLVEYGDWVFLGTQVGTTGATASAIPDATRLKGLALPSTLFNNCIVRIVSGAAAGERTYVDYLDPNAGILYVNPALSVALAATDEYEIWCRGIDPDMVDRLRDDCLQKFCSQWRIVPVSQVEDGDLEDKTTVEAVAITSSTNATPIAVTASAVHGLVTGAQVSIVGHKTNTNANGVWTVTVTSTTVFTLDGSVGNGAGTDGYVVAPNGIGAWTEVGSAVANKLYAVFPHAHSHRILSISHPTAASDYLESALIDVQPAEQWFVQVVAQAYVTATPSTGVVATLDVYDVTNAASIDTGTMTGKGPDVISIQFTVPAGCYQIKLQLKAGTNAATTRWSPFALHKRGRHSFSLPPRVSARKRVGTFFTLPESNEAASVAIDSKLKNAPFQSIERVQVGGQVEIYVNPQTNAFPMYYYERGYFPRLSPNYFTTLNRITGDGAPVDVHKEYIIAALATRVAKYMLDKHGEEWQDDWVRASADFNYWEGQHGPEPRLIVEVESPLYIPQLSV